MGCTCEGFEGGGLLRRSSSLLVFMREVARGAGDRILAADGSRFGVSRKTSDRDLVTDIDVAVQKFIVSKLRRRFPQASFLVEEGDAADGQADVVASEDERTVAEAGEAGQADFADGRPAVEPDESVCGCFIIDPIDGTTNFIRGFHHSAVSIGYTEDGQMRAGVISAPYTDEVFSAEKGCGATLNGEPIAASRRPLSNGLVLLGTSPYDDSNTARTFELARVAYEHALDIRRTASAALDLCYIACGRCEAYFEMQLSPWDFAAGMLIVKEAGGVVTDLDGAELHPWTGDKSGLVAGGVNAWPDLMKLIRA